MYKEDENTLTARLNQRDYAVCHYNYPFANIRMTLARPYLGLIQLLRPEKIEIVLDSGDFRKPSNLSWMAQKLGGAFFLKVIRHFERRMTFSVKLTCNTVKVPG